MTAPQYVQLRQWHNGKWFFNYQSGAPSPMWKSRAFAEKKAREYEEKYPHFFKGDKCGSGSELAAANSKPNA